MREEKEDLVVLNQELEAWKHTAETYQKRYEITRMQLIRSSWILSILLVMQLILLWLILTK